MNTKVIKKVSFAESAKKHDSVVLHHDSIAFYQIICGFFKLKKFLNHKVSRDVKSHKDILHVVNFSDSTLIYCKNRMSQLIKLLENTKKRLEEKQQIDEDDINYDDEE